MIVILGGTGTLGKELTRLLLEINPSTAITVLSRDEQKQQECRSLFPSVRYVIGDVRDRDTLRQAMHGAETVFLLAAMKHVDVVERNPLEGIKTNVFGAMNVAEEAIAAGVSHVVFSNTDKAVLPITTYGYTKALAQNLLLAQNGRSATRFCAYNWGNVIASRGSVIPLFVRSLADQRKVCLTDARMSRFWIPIEETARFMLATYRTAARDRAMIPPIKAAKLVRVAEAVAKIMGVTSYKVDVIGLRGTEKLYEVLETGHDGCLRSDLCEQYTDQELQQLLRPVVEDLSA